MLSADWDMHRTDWELESQGGAEPELEQVLLVHPESPHIPYSPAHLHAPGV